MRWASNDSESQEFGKHFSFLFCFSNSSRWSATLLHTTNCKDKSSLHAPVNTTHAGPKAIPLKNSVLVLRIKTWTTRHIFQSSEFSNILLTQNSMRIQLLESWEICTFLFGSDRRQFISLLPTPDLTSNYCREAPNLQNIFLQFERWPPTCMGMHIGQILSQSVQWMKTFWHPSAKTMHCKDIIIPDELCVYKLELLQQCWIFGI